MEAMGRMGRFLRDQAYDIVFELGDSSLQFIGDMFRGYNEDRHNAFAHRQIGRQERRQATKAPQTKSSAAGSKPRPQKPLSYSEKQSFAGMMGRQTGESIIEHWKRQKMLLACPDKQGLIAQHTELQMRVKNEKMQDHAIQTEMKSISSQYQKKRVAKTAKKQLRGRKR